MVLLLKKNLLPKKEQSFSCKSSIPNERSNVKIISTSLSYSIHDLYFLNDRFPSVIFR